jgi:ATP synthase F1 delta subunit
VTDRTIARRYVRALFELALEQEAADAVLADLSALHEKLGEDLALAAALFDPRADRAAQRAVAARLLPASARPLSRDFVEFLVDRRREQVLPLAASEFEAMLREQRGEAAADAAERAEIAAKLAEITKRKIALSERVDPSLIGGVRARVGSTLLDASVRRRLAEVRERLLHVALPR